MNMHFPAANGSIPCETEADLFAALGLADIPPELREDAGEIDAAESGKLPELIQLDDLAGTFHCHTDWSDGSATLAEMAAAARDAQPSIPGDRRPFAIGGLCRRPERSSRSNGSRMGRRS